MLKESSFSFVLFLLLACSQLAFAQGSQEPKSRAIEVKEAIANLDSKDIKVAAEAARRLGMHGATEAVPKLLEVLQSSRLLRITEHVVAKNPGGLSEWVATDVKADIVNSLGQIGDKRAVPVLEKYLKRPLKNDVVFTGNIAHALYLLTGKSYLYKSYEGVEKLYEPSPFTEEEFRKQTRPDLKPTAGLTASLEIEGHDPRGTHWMGNRPLNINLVITNHTNRIIELDASQDNFAFSTVAGNGERRVTSASLLPSTETRGATTEAIAPGQKLKLTWVVDLKDWPSSREWTGYVNIKCVYTNPRKHKQASIWRGEKLVSNSVERYYYPADQ